MNSEVVFKNLRKVFIDSQNKQEITAVEDFSLKINPGELLTLLGPSGCGKTSVLRLLAGFERPTGGNILLNGRSIVDLPPNQRNSAMVFQSYALFPHMNVVENIGYGLRFLKIDDSIRRERLHKTIEIVGLEGLELRRPSELSGGQQQRVALARALVVEPSILLFDEPLSNLDAKLKESMRVEIRRLQKDLSITTLYVTHDQIEAMSLSDRIVVMNKGRIEQVGSPQEIFYAPKSEFVADFMGIPNRLPAVFSEVGDRVRGVTKDFEIEFPKRADLPVIPEGKLLVRPEDIYLDFNSQIKAQVLEITYLGDCHEIFAELPSGHQIFARIRLEPFQKAPALNEKIGLRFNSSHVTYVP